MDPSSYISQHLSLFPLPILLLHQSSNNGVAHMRIGVSSLRKASAPPRHPSLAP